MWVDKINKIIINRPYLLDNMPMQVWEDANETLLNSVGIYKATVIEPTFDLELNNKEMVVDWNTNTITYNAVPKTRDELVPKEIEKWRAMRILKQHSLWDAFNAYLQTNADAMDEWTLHPTLVRDSQFVIDGLVQLNLTPAQGDDLFIQANKL